MGILHGDNVLVTITIENGQRVVRKTSKLLLRKAELDLLLSQISVERILILHNLLLHSLVLLALLHREMGSMAST